MTQRFSVASWPAWISAVQSVILTSGSTDRHLFKLSCLPCPMVAIAAPSRRQVRKANLQNAFDALSSRVGSNTLKQSLSHLQRSDGATSQKTRAGGALEHK